jgi:curved DNA-binding protein CbpA
VSDFFALLGQPRRPWLDLDSLKETFLQRSSLAHPDRVAAGNAEEKAAANDRFAELNAAYCTLRDTKLRLAHLLQLETGLVPKEIQRIPGAATELVFEAGQLVREADDLIAGKSANTSPMLKVRHFQAGLALTDKLVALQRRLNGVADTIAGELQAMNPQWAQADGVEPERRAEVLALARLAELYQLQSYVSRWTQQLQERVARLAM